MTVDFTLTSAQRALKAEARQFGQDVLRPAAKLADAIADPQGAAAAMRSTYRQAAAAGFTTMFLPQQYGGGGASMVDFLIAIEELCAIDPGFPTTLLVNGLALMPILWHGTDQQRELWLTRACADRTGDFIAGWVVSERGGTANFDHPDPSAGIQLVADLDSETGEYVLNGEKHWPCNAGGWDLRGADLNLCVVRTNRSGGGADSLSALILEPGDPGIEYEVIDKLAHRTCQNVTIRFNGVRVPAENLLAKGDGDLLIQRNFTWSSPIASIAAVGVARAAYDFALKWARTYTGGGSTPIINHQAIGNLLVDIAARIEAGRYLSWKAAHYIDAHPEGGHALGAMSKTFAGDMVQDIVFDCMRIVGVNALDTRFPMAKLYREASVFSLYDAGNLGMQRRRAWGVIADRAYAPDIFANDEEIPFTRSMQGYGVEPRTPGRSTLRRSPTDG